VSDEICDECGAVIGHSGVMWENAHYAYCSVAIQERLDRLEARVTKLEKK